MKPVIVYVDDEAHNLTVFEAALPEDWDVHTFDCPVKAIEKIEGLRPWVIVSDQRMPGMNGVQFLELCRKLSPQSVRVLVTGYSDEDLVVESVRTARVFDYIRKPWDMDDLEARLLTCIEYFQTSNKNSSLEHELKQRGEELRAQNEKLLLMTIELEKARTKEKSIREELQCWVPPFVIWSIERGKVQFPIKKDLVVIAFDIVNSSEIHDKVISGRPLRSQVLQSFSESVIRHGGWRESHTGDSAYAHFGLLDDIERPAEAALSVAREFRVSLRSINEVNDVEIECGIALHVATECTVDVHTVHLNTPRGPVIQKSFDTTSSDIDLLHRMEKFSHQALGTNIILSESFLKQLHSPICNLVSIGSHRFKGQKKSIELYLIPSDKLTEEQIYCLKQQTQVLNVDFEKKSAA